MNCKEHYLGIGVLYLLPADGSYGANMCHPKWIDYWMDCKMPEAYVDPWERYLYGLRMQTWKTIGLLLTQVACNCENACQGKECGTAADGTCDCGTCPPGHICDELHGDCLCVPDCDEKECGDDGCGGTCGTCLGPQDACEDGQCVCQPACDGKECGDDGCGGSCGVCTGATSACYEGECIDLVGWILNHEAGLSQAIVWWVPKNSELPHWGWQPFQLWPGALKDKLADELREKLLEDPSDGAEGWIPDNLYCGFRNLSIDLRHSSA